MRGILKLKKLREYLNNPIHWIVVAVLVVVKKLEKRAVDVIIGEI
jgi:hypothetical protein